jgi:hypothetical protein
MDLRRENRTGKFPSVGIFDDNGSPFIYKQTNIILIVQLYCTAVLNLVCIHVYPCMMCISVPSPWKPCPHAATHVASRHHRPPPGFTDLLKILRSKFTRRVLVKNTTGLVPRRAFLGSMWATSATSDVTDMEQKSNRQKVAMRLNGWLCNTILPAKAVNQSSSFYL